MLGLTWTVKVPSLKSTGAHALNAVMSKVSVERAVGSSEFFTVERRPADEWCGATPRMAMPPVVVTRHTARMKTWLTVALSGSTLVVKPKL